MYQSEEFIRRINRYEGRIVNVRVDEVRLECGASALREVVEHPGGVTVLPLDADGYVYCVRQFRYPFGRALLEIPAGKLEPGETPAEGALRELSEETGIEADSLTPLGEIYATPGYCSETIHMFLARGLRFGHAHPDVNEFLTIEKLHIEEMAGMVMSGEIKDGKTIVAVLKTKYLLEG